MRTLWRLVHWLAGGGRFCPGEGVRGGLAKGGVPIGIC